jgi:hypothetical protein
MGKGWDSFGITPPRRSGYKAHNESTMLAHGRGLTITATQKARGPFIAFLAERIAECLRIAKPGAHALVWALPRTSHWTATALEDAGWIIEDRITHHFGQGFPKHKSKLKPATEDWWLCTKPGGAKWLGVDACRVEGSWSNGPSRLAEDITGGCWAGGHGKGRADRLQQQHPNGRWPTNAVFSHHPDCVPCGTKRIKVAYSQPTAGLGRDTIYRNGDGVSNVSRVGQPVGHADADGMETVEAWQCVPGCPVSELDVQSGERKAAPRGPHRGPMGYQGAEGYDDPEGVRGYGGSGGASRFFPTFAWGDDDRDDLRAFYYCGKATRRDRNEGCEGLPLAKRADDGYGTIQRPKLDRQSPRENWTPHETANHHPTIKPTPLMRWLCRLVTPPGGTILDPFLGSGSTLKAAKLEGFGGIGIEIDPDYLTIADRRIAHVQPALAGLA